MQLRYAITRDGLNLKWLDANGKRDLYAVRHKKEQFYSFVNWSIGNRFYPSIAITFPNKSGKEGAILPFNDGR